MSGANPEDRLYVEFCGEWTTLDAGEERTFGRSADILIDENRHLHRILGRFYFLNNTWWLMNEGRSITIQIADADSRSTIALAPGSEIGLTFPNAVLKFRAGTTDYEMTLKTPDRVATDVRSSDPLDDGDPDDDDWVDETIGLGGLPLTDEQRLLLLALGETMLLEPHGTPEMPTNRAVSRRLNWSITKFNRKLDNLCSRFAKLGVGGLRGSIDQLATDRRRRLVEHAIESHLITRDQLPQLPPEPD